MWDLLERFVHPLYSVRLYQANPSKRYRNRRLTKYVSLWETLLSGLSLSIARQCASPRSNLCHHHLPSTFRLLAADYSSLSHISYISNMTQRPSSSSFQVLFNAALEDYETQTGTRLIDHPFARQIETSNSVDSITAALREQAQIFRGFRGDDGKIMKSLKSSVDVLYTLSNSTILGEAIGLVRPKSFVVVPCS